jgi:BASS family bile acid:Na+ symporter
LSAEHQSIHFSENGLSTLNAALGLIMFGIALGMDRRDFKQVLQHPKPVLVGLTSQFLLLPLVTMLLIFILKPRINIAYGMILVAACPGGNISNYISYLSRANVALSVTLTALSTFGALFFTPFNFAFYSAWISAQNSADVLLSVDSVDVIKTIFLLIVVPLSAGLLIRERFPVTAHRIERPFKILSLFIFFGFIFLALYNNFSILIREFKTIFVIVLLHNTLAFASGYLLSRYLGLDEKNSRTISIETGIQNSGLGLALIFNFFEGNPDMALIAAGWGIWHIIAGFGLSLVWKSDSR